MEIDVSEKFIESKKLELHLEIIIWVGKNVLYLISFLSINVLTIETLERLAQIKLFPPNDFQKLVNTQVVITQIFITIALLNMNKECFKNIKQIIQRKKEKERSLSHVLGIPEISINKKEEELSAKYSSYSFHIYSLLRNLVDYTERMLTLENRNMVSIFEKTNSPRILCLTLFESLTDVVLAETENFQIVGNNLLMVRLKDKNLRITEKTEEVNKERVILEHMVCMLNDIISEVKRNSLIDN